MKDPVGNCRLALPMPGAAPSSDAQAVAGVPQPPGGFRAASKRQSEALPLPHRLADSHLTPEMQFESTKDEEEILDLGFKNWSKNWKWLPALEDEGA